MPPARPLGLLGEGWALPKGTWATIIIARKLHPRNIPGTGVTSLGALSLARKGSG